MVGACSLCPVRSAMSAAASSAEISAAKRERRVAGIFFPAILLRDRTVAKDKADGVAHHRPPALELAQSAGSFAAQQIEQQNGERGFVHLDAAPVGTSVEPEILRPVARGFLRGLQVAQDADRIGDRSGGQQRASGFDQVARPDQMVAAEIFIAFVESPGNREAGDDAAQKIFGLVRPQHRSGCAVQIVLAQRLIEFEQRGLPISPLRRRSAGEFRRSPRRAWIAPAGRPRSKSRRSPGPARTRRYRRQDRSLR